MRQTLADFDASLDRIRMLADNVAANTGAALADSRILALHETQQCGAIVLLTGYFEAFLKDAVRSFIGKLSRSGLFFAALPDIVQHRHYEGGGRALTRASEATRKGRAMPFGNASREDIVARLHSTTSGTGSYQIVWEAFADTGANPRPEVVKNIARNLGVSQFWPTVSRKTGDSVRWSETSLTTLLSDLIAKRNECAHTGRVAPVPTASEILAFVDLLHTIGEGFVGILEEKLAQLTNPGAGTMGAAAAPRP